MSKLVAAIFTIALIVGAQQPVGPDEIRGGVEAYTPPPHSNVTIRTQVDLVEVPVVVRDGSRTVAGLQRSDFQITDSGHPREISSFNVETVGRPASPVSTPASDPVSSPANEASSKAPTHHTSRYIGFLFDDININDGDLIRVKKAAGKFLKDSFSSDDRAAIATTAWTKPPVFSSDAAELEKQIQALHSNPRAGGAADLYPTCPTMNLYETYELANHLDPQLMDLKIREYVECKQMAGVQLGRDEMRGAQSAAQSTKARLDDIGRSTLEQAVLMMATHSWELQRSNSENTLHGVRALVDAMAELPGRKMIVLTSSGFLTGTLEIDLEEIMRRARMADVTINSLESRGLVAYTPGTDVTKATPPRSPRTIIEAEIQDLQTQDRRELAVDDGIAALAIGTGGRMFENNNDLAAGYRDLAGVPEVVYVLGISVSDAQDGKYHPLKVHLTSGHHGSIQARPGYLASLPVKAQEDIAKERPAERSIDREFVDGRTMTAFPGDINVAPHSAASTITAFAHVDLTRVNFERRDGRRIQKLTFIAGLMNPDGTFLRGKQAHYDLALTEPTYQRYIEQGFNITVTLDAPPGKYVLRGIVAEGTTGRTTATSRSIQVH